MRHTGDISTDYPRLRIAGFSVSGFRYLLEVYALLSTRRWREHRFWAAGPRAVLSRSSWSVRTPTQGRPDDGQTPRWATPVGATRVRLVPPRRPRRVEERPAQQDDPAGEPRERQGRLLQDPHHASRPAVPAAAVADGAYFITESNITGTPREHRVEYTLGSRRIQHYLTTHRQAAGSSCCTPSWDVQRRRVVRQHGDRPPGRRRSDAGAAVEQELRRLPRQPAGQPLHAGHADLRDGVGRLRHVAASAATVRAARTSDKYRERRAVPAAIARSSGRRASIRRRAAWSARSATRCATSSGPASRAGADYYDYFQPVLEYGPRKESDPTYWADGRPRRFSNDAMGLWQSACFLRGGATCTSCHRDPHLPDVDKNPQLAHVEQRALHRLPQRDRRGRDVAHAPPRRTAPGSSCVECHMPQTVLSIKARIRDHSIEPAGAGEHGTRSRFPTPATSATRTRSRRGRWTRSRSGGRMDAARSWWRAPRRSPGGRAGPAGGAGRSARARDGPTTAGPLVQANADRLPAKLSRTARALDAPGHAAKGAAIRQSARAALGLVRREGRRCRSPRDAAGRARRSGACAFAWRRSPG